MEKLQYTEAEKEGLIDSMLGVIKTKLMQSEFEDISIGKERGISGFYRQDGSPLAQFATGE